MMCGSMLISDSKTVGVNAVMIEEFEQNWIPELKELCSDKIVNVRIQLAWTLNEFYKKFEISSIHSTKQYRDRLCDNYSLQSMVHRLKFDSCRDVKMHMECIYTRFDSGEEPNNFQIGQLPVFREEVKTEESPDDTQTQVQCTEEEEKDAVCEQIHHGDQEGGQVLGQEDTQDEEGGTQTENDAQQSHDSQQVDIEQTVLDSSDADIHNQNDQSKELTDMLVVQQTDEQLIEQAPVE